jgi:hypothetical protein
MLKLRRGNTQYVIKFDSLSFSSTNKTDRHDITDVLLKVASNTLILHITTYSHEPSFYHLDNSKLLLIILSTSQVLRFHGVHSDHRVLAKVKTDLNDF